MNEEEARTIASIVVTADGECFVCAGRLLLQLQHQFPFIDWEHFAQMAGWGHDLAEFKKEWS